MNKRYGLMTSCLWFFLIAVGISVSAGEKGFPVNEIDGFLGNRMVSKAEGEPLVEDRGFLRRVWLDLAGRLPGPEVTDRFLADRRSDKRARMIQEILASDAFTDRWSNFMGELFRNRALTEDGPFRNAFYFQLRKMVDQNMPWDQMAREILVSQGSDSDEASALQFWLAENAASEYRLDVLDDQISFISDTMLGMRVECISCHNGAYHLEDVNKGLSTLTRKQFWGMAAFLSESYLRVERQGGDRENARYHFSYADLDDPDFSLGNGVLYASEEFLDGEYRAESKAGDGMRPPRHGGVIQPAYLTTGETPRPGELRREALARMITSDRQFARNMVNRLWAHLFGEGFVEPVDSWDLARLNAETAATFETTVQARTPDLMEFLTDLFIDGGYDLRYLIGQIANSKLYQWDYLQVSESDPDHPWHEWRSNQRVRRIEAEAIVDSIHQVLGLTQRYTVSGLLDRTFSSTWQMPDTYEPNPLAIYSKNGRSDQLRVSPQALGYDSLEEYLFQQYLGFSLLQDLGRGDRANMLPRKSETSIPSILLMMNRTELNYWLESWAEVPLIHDLGQRLNSGGLSPTDVTNLLFRRILYREPTPGEVKLFRGYFKSHEVSRALRDMVWSLLNHPDFIHK